MDAYKHIRRFTLGLITAISLNSCYFCDPSMVGEVAPYSSDPWIPCCDEDAQRHFPVLPCEDAVDEMWYAHSGAWEAIELVDIALRNNPTTRETWETAKARAYTWKATQSALYPTINLTEELLIEKVQTKSVAGDIEANTGNSTTTFFTPGTGSSSNGNSTNSAANTNNFSYNQ